MQTQDGSEERIYKELEESGTLRVESVKEKVFPDSPEMQEELVEKLDKYNLADAVVEPKTEKTIKKFQKQHLTTDTGIEITIPMEEYGNPESGGIYYQSGWDNLGFD